MYKTAAFLATLMIAINLGACKSLSSDYEQSQNNTESSQTISATEDSLSAVADNRCDEIVSKAIAIDQNITNQITASGGFTLENALPQLPNIKQGGEAFRQAYACTSKEEYAQAANNYARVYNQVVNAVNASSIGSTSDTTTQQPSQTQPGYSENFLNTMPVQCRPAAEAGAPAEVVRECIDEHFRLIESIRKSIY